MTPTKCPYCGGLRTRAKGIRVTKAFGIRKIRYCNTCHRKFTVKRGRRSKTAVAGKKWKGRGRRR